jgi:ABC-type Fe3+ transport system substrate-binding protein
MAAGEFDLVVPAADNRVRNLLDKKAPVGYHCPDPVPLSTSELIIMKGSPNQYAAKIYVNWLLSKEGQISQYAVTKASPVHRALQTEHFLPMPSEVQGRKLAFAGDAAKAEVLLKYWSQKWLGAGGAAPQEKSNE